MRACVCVFVYGTLKRGFSHHHLLGEARFRGEARTAPHYRLVDCGGFPGLLEGPPGLAVRGEVWEIEEELLPLLDTYEAVEEGEYRREPVRLEGEWEPGSVWAYLYAWPRGPAEPWGAEWTVQGLR